jgi:hypothetical protein
MNPTTDTTRRSTFAGLLLFALTLFIGLTSVTPASAQAYCPPNRRDCLVFVAKLSDSKMSPAQKAFYNFLEFGASTTAALILAPRYRKVHLVEGTSADREALWKKLDQVSRNSSVWAVDMVFVSHGLTGAVQFNNQTVNMSTIRDDIKSKIPYAYRKKLRAVFDTSCYSASHRSYWISAGFKTASGSRRIYADSIVTYPLLLSAWANYSTFQHSVQIANGADPMRVIDNAAKNVLRSWGYAKWWDVDSYRYLSGSISLRIYHRPY